MVSSGSIVEALRVIKRVAFSPGFTIVNVLGKIATLPVLAEPKYLRSFVPALNMVRFLTIEGESVSPRNVIFEGEKMILGAIAVKFNIATLMGPLNPSCVMLRCPMLVPI
jgi:hypothetical protein